MEYYEHFQTELALFKTHLSEPANSFVALMNFLGQVAQCYPDVVYVPLN